MVKENALKIVQTHFVIVYKSFEASSTDLTLDFCAMQSVWCFYLIKAAIGYRLAKLQQWNVKIEVVKLTIATFLSSSISHSYLVK